MFAHVPTQDSGQWLVLSVWKQQLGDTLLSCKAEDCCRFHRRLVVRARFWDVSHLANTDFTFSCHLYFHAQNQATIAIILT